MNGIAATIENGMIVPREPLAWPEGSEVLIQIRSSSVKDPAPGEEHDPLGIFGDDPESIERWIALAATAPGIVISDEEWDAMQARRREEKAIQLRLQEARDQKLSEQWG